MVGMINRVSALEELISNGRDNQIISQINIKSQVSQVRRRKDRGGLGVRRLDVEEGLGVLVRQWLK